jgi:FHS family Na+ dependent glucose MFS transporter 1
MSSPPTASRLPYLWAYYCCLVGVGLMVGILGPTLGALAAQTGTTLQGISIILAMRPLGYLGGTLLSGRLLDRMPGHPILAGAVALAAGMIALMPLTPMLGVLAAFVLVMGFAQGLMDVGSNTLIVWVYHDKVGPYLNGLHFSFGVGAFLGPLLVAQSLAWTGATPWTFWVLALCLLPLIFLLLRVPSPAHEHSEERVRSAPWDKALAALFIGFFFLYGGSEAGFGAWIYSYATHLHLADPVHAAYLSSVFWGLLGLGRLIGIPIIAKVSPRRFLSVLIPLVLASLGTLLAWPQSSAALWAGSIGMGLSMACIFPTLLIYAGPKLAKGGRVSGRITSFFFVGSSTGSMILPWLMGQAFEPWGPRAALGLAFGALALMGAVFLAILKRSD